jgi:hypothetical protein
MDFDETMTEPDYRCPPDSSEEAYFVSAEARRPAGAASEEAESAPFALEMDAWEPSLLRKLLGQ